MKTNLAVALTMMAACAAARPSPELIGARAAYQNAEQGPAGQLNLADLHEAHVLLLEAENDPSGDAGKHKAYLALRRAELADVQGRTSAAARERDAALQRAAALKDQSLANAKGQLADAAAAQAQTQGELAQTQAQLGAEHQSRVEMHGQLADAASTQQQTQSRLDDAQGRLAAEHARATEQAALDALARIGQVRREPRGMVITLADSVLFASGKTALLGAAEDRLDRLAEVLLSNERTILVEGHTDSRGAEAKNRQLSQRRAQSVANYLIGEGVPAARIRVQGLGSGRPVTGNGTEEGRASNRRVEVVVESGK